MCSQGQATLVLARPGGVCVSCHRMQAEEGLWAGEGPWALYPRGNHCTCWRHSRSVKRARHQLQTLRNRSQGSICSVTAKIVKRSRYKIKAKTETTLTFWCNPTVDDPLFLEALGTTGSGDLHPSLPNISGEAGRSYENHLERSKTQGKGVWYSPGGYWKSWLC